MFTLAVGLALIALGLTGLWEVPGLTLTRDAPSWVFVPLLLIGSLAVSMKRRAPVAALLVGAAAFGTDTLLGGSIAGFLYFVDLLYNAALVGSPRVRRLLWIAAGILVLVPTVATLLGTGEVRWGVLVGLQQAAMFFLPLWWAKDVRTSTELATLAAARADAVERLAASERREAVRAERDALARELHDAVASHLSSIALHSGGALATPADADKDRNALELARRSSLESMREMHSLITLLRDHEHHSDQAPTARLPTLNDIRDFADRSSVAGTSVEVTGLDSIGDLPATVGLTGYRIVQEAVANAARHAPGQPVHVDVRNSPSTIAISIRNPMCAERTASSGDDGAGPVGSGLGLTIMRERAVALGGTARIDAQPDQWTVTVDLPRGRTVST